MDKQNLPKLRDLTPSPNINPLLTPQNIKTRKRKVWSGTTTDLVNSDTGELTHISAIHTIEEKDDDEFVKVFAAGVAATYELNKTAQRVFHAVLNEYQQTPMNNGYADSLHLIWFDSGLCGKDIGMSETTFNRGLRELVVKKFLYPKYPSVYWVNPALFFKGNRVLFLKEYRRKSKVMAEELPQPTKGGLAKQNDPYTADLLG